MRLRPAAVLLATCAAILSPPPARAWDYPGHRIVGAVADLVLQRYHPRAQKRVSELLEIQLPGGLWQKRSLREVAVFPDCAKRNNEPFCGRPPSDEEKEYASRNPGHDAFHFTDVPLHQTAYVVDSAGTAETDVVHMIDYVVAQLRGKHPAAKDGVRLTNTEAVWLLAHLVGDIHQPLHVGAKYFKSDDCETSVDPNVAGNGLPNFGIGTVVAETRGGNLIRLVAPAPAVPATENLHFYWDGTSVLRAMQAVGLAQSEQEFAKQLAADPPAGWETSGGPDTWAVQWANEIMPLAGSAHDRLTIRKSPNSPAPSGTGPICTWQTTVDSSYLDWSKANARIQLAKAGFRLAALLRAIFEP